MPVQLIRNVRQRQPLKAAKIDYSNPISKKIVFAFEAGAGQRDLVTGVAGESIGSGVSPSAGKFGRNFDFSGAQANRSCSFGIHMGLMGATSATWDILIYFDSANPTAHFFGQWDQDLRWLLQASGGNLVWVAAQDAGGSRRRFDSSSSVFPSSGWYRLTASWLGGSNKVVVINGVDKTSSFYEATNVAMNIASTNTLDYLQVGITQWGTALAGNVCFARAWKRGLSLSECLSLHEKPWQIFEPETIPLFFSTVTAQYARPVSDVSAGGWTASTGSDLFAMLDESAADDGDYITSTTASTCEVALGSLTDPASSTGHIVRYRISATGGGIIVRLREGSTTIASWTHNPAPASPTTYAQTLSGSEADSIINYAALKLQFEAIT